LADHVHDPREGARYYASTVDVTVAPETEFFSATEIRCPTSHWTRSPFSLEKNGQDGPFRVVPRTLANNVFGPIIGLEIYMLLV
jgi:hypothetical protein